MAKPSGGDWLVEEMTALRAAGVDILLCALTTTELDEAGLTDEPRAAHNAGLEFVSVPIVDWPDEDDDDPRLHWKTRHLVEWAAGRRFVWVDDEITDADRTWVAANHSVPALLHRVDPRRGLTDAYYTAIAGWLMKDGSTA